MFFLRKNLGVTREKMRKSTRERKSAPGFFHQSIRESSREKIRHHKPKKMRKKKTKLVPVEKKKVGTKKAGKCV